MKELKTRLKQFIAGVVAVVICSNANAADAESCRTVRFGTMAWTDLIATTAVARVLFEQLGYQTTDTSAAQQVIFSAIRDNRLDTFLGYWKPSADPTVMPFLERKEFKVSQAPNLSDGQMTLAVPSWLAAKGLKTFSDIHRFKTELDGKIYGIEPGTDVNRTVQDAIDKNLFNLKDFKLVESSEAGMLSSVLRANKRKSAVLFIAWKPHPMNINFDLTYLSGSDDIMGPDEGKATVWTLTRNNYSSECPNASTLLNNLQFSSNQESEMMEKILNKERPSDVAKQFIKDNPDIVKSWLRNVTAFSTTAPALTAN